MIATFDHVIKIVAIGKFGTVTYHYRGWVYDAYNEFYCSYEWEGYEGDELPYKNPWGRVNILLLINIGGVKNAPYLGGAYVFLSDPERTIKKIDSAIAARGRLWG